MKRLIAFAMVCALLPACSGDKKPAEKEKPAVTKKEEKSKKDPAKKPRPVKVASLSADLPRTKGGEVPVFEEYEEEANRTVAVENLEAELDRLEAEIAGDSE